MLGSVVIPTHNEAAAIRRCLDALVEDFRPGELEVIVACNGCTDDSAELARSCSYPITVLELASASKVGALRAADAVALSFPRIYLDADIVMPALAAREVLERLRKGPALAGRPPIWYDTSRASAIVRSYYRARQRIPNVMGSLWGAGTFSLSQAGRARFGPFPDVVAEDLFVDQQFERHEIEIVHCPPVVVTTPRRLADLIRILRRTYRGNSEIRHATDGRVTTSSVDTLREAWLLARTGPSASVDTVTYIACALMARLLVRVGGEPRWERDESSRAA